MIFPKLILVWLLTFLALLICYWLLKKIHSWYIKFYEVTWYTLDDCRLKGGKIDPNHKVVKMILYEASPKEYSYAYTEQQQWMFLHKCFINYQDLVNLVEQIREEKLLPFDHPYVIEDNLPINQ